MTGIYFSGTGNSRYAAEVFLREYDEAAKDIVFAYSVQYSNLPKMVKDFVDANRDLWQGTIEKYLLG